VDLPFLFDEEIALRNFLNDWYSVSIVFDEKLKEIARLAQIIKI